MLEPVRTPGDFYVTGTSALALPSMEVQGVGSIALPLIAAQAAQLISAAERAPYGRGAQTLVDTQVRRTWQIGAQRVRIQGRRWEQTLLGIVAQAAAGLGVAVPARAALYKLLIYDEGSFFVSHRDTEKAPGMFATLIIALPSTHTGGELVVSHQGRQARLDLRCDDPAEVAFAAFYADCVHEVQPVTSGHRLILVYNLLRQGTGRLPKPPSYEAQTARIAQLLQQWAADQDVVDEQTPRKLVYPLEHAYTQAELSFEGLKAADAARAAVLDAAAQQAACELHVTLLTIEESGSAEHLYDGYRGRRWARSEEDDEDFEIVEVCDRSATLSNWQRPDGGRTSLDALPFSDEELSPSGALRDLNPDEQYFHEATGNEGASFERSYRRAALVIWPQRHRLAVLAAAGLAACLPYLDTLTSRWVGSGEEAHTPTWRDAHELCSQLLRTWKPATRYPGRSEHVSQAGKMLALLARLKDEACIDAFAAGISAAGGDYGAQDNDVLLRALGALTVTRAVELIEQVVAANAARDFSACAALLAQAAAIRWTRGLVASDLTSAARALVGALPKESAGAPRGGHWWPRPIDAEVVADVLWATGQIDAALAASATDHFLGRPQTYDLDDVVLPATTLLIERSEPRELAVLARLREACLEHLRARIAQRLAPPSDWARDAKLVCKCSSCTELGCFLASVDKKAWSLKAAESVRGHVEGTIRQSQCDVGVATDKSGRPHTLVCTKNQASYDRRAQQRKQDLEAVTRLQDSVRAHAPGGRGKQRDRMTRAQAVKPSLAQAPRRSRH